MITKADEKLNKGLELYFLQLNYNFNKPTLFFLLILGIRNFTHFQYIFIL